MQENRSFDHYFGTLSGVRGFDDPRAVSLPSGAPVWQQPDGEGHVSPFHPDAPDLGLQFLVDLPHAWADTQDALNQGKYDRWIPNKSAPCMAYLTRRDIPFHFALADAFTVCDAYHCSFLGATDPNRYHMWTGWLGNDGQGGGPVLDNSEAGYDWSTYPERLERAGISWKIYQDAGAGLDAEHFWGWGNDAYIGNYGDNSLLYFHQYQNALPGSPLFNGARTATNVSEGGSFVELFAADVRANRLPQISWIVAPEAYTEHGNWPTNYGAWYIAQFLDALTANPEVWSKTALFLTYDENDGFFDHMVPPTPPLSPAQGWSTVDTANEIFPGNAHFGPGPIGLGVRVPMLVISPWSRGGFVSSEVFDHTSLIQFIERRFARHRPDLIETNITKWRRAVAGDLTSAFDFANPNGRKLSLPNTAGYVPPDRDRHPDYVPAPPADQSQPRQEPGARPARPVPYELHAAGVVKKGALEIKLRNTGKAAAVFQARVGQGPEGPWTFTVGPGEAGSQTWPVPSGTYDLSVYGPNGFLRSFQGSVGGRSPANLGVTTQYEPDRPGLNLEIENRGAALSRVRLANVYTGEERLQNLRPGEFLRRFFALERTSGWYDLTIEVESDHTFRRRLAGHVETGCDSMTDPAIGRR
jgi:phospholipase C